MKKLKPKPKARKPKPIYRAADLEKLQKIMTHLNYHNRMVASQAKDDMKAFIEHHGQMATGLMIAHLQAGDPICDGTLICAGAASMTQELAHG